MKRRMMLGALAGLATMTMPAFAGDKDPLFVNLTSDDPHRVRMALNFSLNQLKKGHPVAIFFNDKGVFAASVKKADVFAEQQKMAAEILAGGGELLVCPMCMKHYGVVEADLLPGAQVGNPDKTGAALFKDNGKTLTW